MNIPAFLNRASPLDLTVAKDCRTSASELQVSSPIPPPPAVAFSMTYVICQFGLETPYRRNQHTGKPSPLATSTASSSLFTRPCEPGTIGTPALVARSLAVCLSPNASMLSGEGPANTIPAAVAALAKSAFSDKNPYPGMIASTLFRFAMSMI